VTGRGVVRTIDPVAVQLSRANIRQIAVPDLVGVFRERNAFGLRATGRIEEAEIYPLGVG
jgi:hypothetical protein